MKFFIASLALCHFASLTDVNPRPLLGRVLGLA